MTDIQVRYWTNKESQRHNIATENQAANELNETVRHNLSSENINQQQVSENVRHNKVNEGQNLLSLQETKRHNLVGESQGQQNINEAVRHNKRTERTEIRKLKENTRHNKAGERLTAQSNAIAQQNANTQASKVAAENALTSAKTWAQNWLNKWRQDNPTTASLREAGVMTSNSEVGKALQIVGIGNDALAKVIKQLERGQNITPAQSKQIVKTAIANKSAVKAGADKRYTYYQLVGLTNSKGKNLYFRVDNKTGALSTPSKMTKNLRGLGSDWLTHSVGAYNDIKY